MYTLKNTSRSALSAIFLLTVCFSFSHATDYVSNGAGTVWGTSTNWTPNGIPGSGDNVTIAATHTVSMGANRTVNNLTIDAGGRLTKTSSFILSIDGNLVNNGTIAGGGTGGVNFNTNAKSISGTGTFQTTASETWTFNVNTSISSEVVINKRNPIAVASGVVVTNNGSVTISNNTITGASGTWTNAANSFLQVNNAMTVTTLNASASPNTVVFHGGTMNIKTPSSNTYHHLTVQNGGTKTMLVDLTINGNLDVANTTTVNVNSRNVTLGGNWSLNASGVINNNINNTCTFNNNTTLSGTNAFSFNNVTVSGTLTLTSDTAIIAGNLVNNGTVNHNSGTVVFNGTTAVSGSGTPSFNHVTVSNTLTASSGTMNIAGNFINNGTFTHNSGTILFNGTSTLSGSSAFTLNNISITGVMTVPAANVNVAGNFANSGTFNHSNGTITFTGITTVSGASTTSFNNMTVSGTLTGHATNMAVAGNFIHNGTFNHNSGTVTFSGITTLSGTGSYSFNGVTISGTLTVPAANVDVAGNFANNGTFNHSSGTITFNGTTTVSGSNPTSFNHVLISGTFTAHATDMAIGGDFTQNGTFNHNSGTINFNGTAAAQTIDGSAASITFGGMILDNALGVTTNLPLNIVLSVYITQGTFHTAANAITLISTVGNTAFIGNSSGGAIDGSNWIAQRYIAGSTADWNDLSTSIAGNNISDWDTELYMSIGALCPDGTAGTFYSVYTWDVNTQAFVPVTNCAENLPASGGFELWLGTDISSLAATTMDSRGTPTLGNVPAALASSAAEFSLIGNPYASSIDWSSAYADALGLLNGFYIYDETIQDYAFWDGDMLSGTAGSQLENCGGIIAAHQGFWVENSGGGPSLTFTENHKSTTNTPLVRKRNPENVLKMRIHKDGMKNSSEAVIKIKDDVSESYNAGSDFSYLKSRNPLTPSLTPLTAENKKMRVKTIPVRTSFSIPVISTFGVAGEYQIDFSEVASISKYKRIVLEDTEAKIMLPLNTDKTYRFTHQDTTMERRFILHFSNSRVASNGLPESALDAFSSVQGVDINFYFEEMTEVAVSVHNALGQEVLKQNLRMGKERITLPLVPAGQIYFISATTAEGTVTKKIVH